MTQSVVAAASSGSSAPSPGPRNSGRRLRLESDVAGQSGVEDDQPDPELFVLVSGVGAGVVELVEDVRVDASGALFAVVCLRSARTLERHVVWVDLGTHAVEQD